MKTETLKTYQERILSVQLYIQDHLSESLKLEQLAKRSGFAVFHFHRIFGAMVGEPCQQYIRRLRLERAALKLRQTEKSILNLALDANFETHESFSRAFKAMFGITPSEFRKNPQAEIKQAKFLQQPCFLRKGKAMNREITIVELEPKHIAFIRHIGDYTKVGPTFEKLIGWATDHGLIHPKTEYLGICYDDPKVTPIEKLRYDAAITIDEKIVPQGEIGIQQISGGTHAMITHHGPYETLPQTYDYLYGTWLPTSGREPAEAPPFEMYLNTPENTEPEELLTDIFLPIK